MLESHSYGYVSCPKCGVSLTVNQLNDHECTDDQFIAHEQKLFRDQLDKLEAEMEEWLLTPRAQHWHAFIEWCEKNGYA